MLKEIKDTNKWKCSGLEDLLLRCHTTQVIYSYREIQSLSTSSWLFLFCRNRRLYPNIHMACQRTPNHQNNLEKEQAWKRTKVSHTDFKAYYEARVIKTVWNRHKDRPMVYRAQKYTFTHMIKWFFDKDVSIIQLGKGSFFNQWCLYLIGDLKMVNFISCIIYHNF